MSCSSLDSGAAGVVAAHSGTDLNRCSSRENPCRSVARLMRNQNLKIKMMAQMVMRQRWTLPSLVSTSACVGKESRFSRLLSCHKRGIHPRLPSIDASAKKCLVLPWRCSTRSVSRATSCEWLYYLAICGRPDVMM